MTILEWWEELSLATGAEALVPAAMFAISVAFFGVVIFNLHRSMSVRNVLGIDLSGLRRSGRPLFILLYCLAYVGMYGLVFPFFAYVWFWLLAAMLAFLYNAKEPRELLLIAMAVLTAVRVTAYYNEDLSKDISKILPYGLLGIFLVNLGQFDLGASIALLESVGAEEDIAFYYWVYISGQELVLRVSQPCVTASYDFVKALIGNQVKGLAGRFWTEGGNNAASSGDGAVVAAESVETAADDPEGDDGKGR